MASWLWVTALVGVACACAAQPGRIALSRASGDLSSFSVAAFRRPDSLYSPSLMWIWNDRLSAETIDAQLADMAEHGVLGAMPVPEPREFRPTWMPTRLEPDYLSPEFVDLVGRAAETAARRGMRLWLYDEGGWPSGSVCGRLVRENPDLVRQVLDRTEEAPVAGSTVTAPPTCLVAALTSPGGRTACVTPGGSVRVQEAGSTWHVYTVTRRGSYPDLLDPRASDAFLRMTHDTYARALGPHFGRAIPAVFTDEPQASARPWTGDLPAAFRDAYGYDILERLGSLFGGDTRADAQVRIDYFDWWSRRFADAYLGRIQDWCRRHGVLSVGHLNGEDETLGATRYGYGNLMRCMRRLDIPGIDVIWRQLWPGQRNSDFPLHAASVAHQAGTPWTLSESFAVYGSGLTPEQMKWLLDYQLVRGITLFNLVCYPYSTADWLIGGERPHFHTGDPLWPWMPLVTAYASRTGYALSAGRPNVSTALYFPIRDLWAGGPHAVEAAAAYEEAARTLLEAQVGFDLVDDDALATASVGPGGVLSVGAAAYGHVVVPACRWMPVESRARVEESAGAGGRVVWLVGPAWSQAPPGAVRVALRDVPGHITPLVRAQTPSPWLRAIGRVTGSGNVYLLTNEGEAPLRATVQFAERTRPLRLDAETGDLLRVSASRRTGSERLVEVDLPHAGSLLLFFPARSRVSRSEPGAPGEDLRVLAEGWTVRAGDACTLTADGLATGPVRGAPAMPVRLGDWREALGEGFSGEAVYAVAFDIAPGEAAQAAWLDLGEVRHAARVRLNGDALPGRAWQPWQWDVRGRLRPGRNALEVTVANTMANQYVTTRALDRWTPAQLGPYHPRALGFEPDSLSSGLMGPVVLRSAGVRRPPYRAGLRPGSDRPGR